MLLVLVVAWELAPVVGAVVAAAAFVVVWIVVSWPGKRPLDKTASTEELEDELDPDGSSTFSCALPSGTVVVVAPVVVPVVLVPVDPVPVPVPVPVGWVTRSKFRLSSDGPGESVVVVPVVAGSATLPIFGCCTPAGFRSELVDVLLAVGVGVVVVGVVVGMIAGSVVVVSVLVVLVLLPDPAEPCASTSILSCFGALAPDVDVVDIDEALGRTTLLRSSGISPFVGCEESVVVVPVVPVVCVFPVAPVTTTRFSLGT